MSDPRPEIVRMWLPAAPSAVMAIGHAIMRCDAATGHVVTPIAYCQSPVVAQAMVQALHTAITMNAIVVKESAK